MSGQTYICGWVLFKSTTSKETIDEVIALLELEPKHFRLIAHESGETTLDISEALNHSSYVDEETFTTLRTKYDPWIRNGGITLNFIGDADYMWEKQDAEDVEIISTLQVSR